MLHQARQDLLCPPDGVGHGRTVDVQPHRQGVDEQPERLLDPFAAVQPPEQERPEHDVLAARDPRQHERPGEVVNVATLTPSVRAARRRRAVRSCGNRRRASLISRPSPRASSKPNGLVGSSTSPSIRVKNCSWLSRAPRSRPRAR